MNQLFQPLSIANSTLKNRIVMAPMCMYSSDQTGKVKIFHHHHYVQRAMGSVGAIVLEATAVEKRGRISANDLGIWSDEHISGLSGLVDEIKQWGTTVGIQLAHAGRKCGVEGEIIIGPSALLFDDHYLVPVEMTEEMIQEVIMAFVLAAERAYKAGFDFIEVHAAHGYLINSFMSPLTNKRQDPYGISVGGGTTFLIALLKGMRQVLPSGYPIWLRISAEDYDNLGNHPQDWVAKLKGVKGILYDAVHVSSGGVVPVRMNPYPGYQISGASIIKNALDKPVIAGGLITEAEAAYVIVATGQSDAVFLGRELLRNPYWPLQAAYKLGVDIKWPEAYERAKK